MIRLHWWNHGRNFGDALSPLICERLSRRWTEWAPLEQCDLLGAGSLLATHHHPSGAWARFRGLVWGTGCMYAATAPSIASHQIRAVRGPLSAEALAVTGATCLGDPALLIREMIHCPSHKKFRLGIVPHWSDRGHPFLQSISVHHTDVLVIDPTEEPLTVVSQIADCQALLSSSLHGLIIADSLQIPSRWMRLESGWEEMAGATRFKFEDYFALWGLPDTSPIVPSPSMTLEDYLLSIPDHRDYSRLDAMCDQLKRSFPFSPS